MSQGIDTCEGCKFIGAHRCDTCARKYVDRYERKPSLAYSGGSGGVFPPPKIKYHDDRTIVHHGGRAVIKSSESTPRRAGSGSERNGGDC